MLRTLLVRHLTPRVHDGRHHVVRRGICTCTQRVLRECVVHPHRCCAPFLCAASHHACLTPGTRGRERHLHLRTARAQKCVVHPRRCCAPFFFCAASHHACLTPGTRGRERHLHLHTVRAQKKCRAPTPVLRTLCTA